MPVTLTYRVMQLTGAGHGQGAEELGLNGQKSRHLILVRASIRYLSVHKSQ